MKHSFTIRDEAIRQNAIDFLRNVPLEPVWQAVFKEYKKDRSASQFGLYWIWMTEISTYTGETKDEVHRRMKKKHLIPIYMEDPDSGMAETVLAVRAVFKKGLMKDAKVLENMIVNLVSTGDANVKQFARYLEEVEKETISQGITLSHPEDIWREAMGK